MQDIFRVFYRNGPKRWFLREWNRRLVPTAIFETSGAIYCPPDQHSRTVLCIKVPTFAIHDDVHELFEEVGFDVSVIASVVLFNVVPDFPKATCYNAV